MSEPASPPVTAKRHKHTFTALWWSFGPFGRQDVHVHDCMDDACCRVLLGEGRDGDYPTGRHWRESLP